MRAGWRCYLPSARVNAWAQAQRVLRSSGEEARAGSTAARATGWKPNRGNQAAVVSVSRLTGPVGSAAASAAATRTLADALVAVLRVR